MIAALLCGGSVYAPADAERAAAIARADQVFGDTLVAASRPRLQMDRSESKGIGYYAATSFSAVPEEIAFCTLVCKAYDLASKEVLQYKEEFDNCIKQQEHHQKHIEWLQTPGNEDLWNLFMRQAFILAASGASEEEQHRAFGVSMLGLAMQSYMSKSK